MTQEIESWHWNDTLETCVKEDNPVYDGTRLTIVKSPSSYFALIPVHVLAGGTNLYSWSGDGKDAMFGISTTIKSTAYGINDNSEIAVIVVEDVGGGDMRDTIYIYNKAGVEQRHMYLPAGITVDYLAIGTEYVAVECSDGKIKFYKLSDGAQVADVTETFLPRVGTKFLCSTVGDWVAYGGDDSRGDSILKSLSATGCQAVAYMIGLACGTGYGVMCFASVFGEKVDVKSPCGVSKTFLIDKDNSLPFEIASGDVPAAVSSCGGYICQITDIAIKRWLHELPSGFTPLDDISLPFEWQVGASGCDLSWYGRYIAILFNTSPKKTAIYSKPRAAIVCEQINTEEIPPLMTTPKLV